MKIYVGLDRQSSNLILKDLGQISKLSEQLEALWFHLGIPEIPEYLINEFIFNCIKPSIKLSIGMFEGMPCLALKRLDENTF